MGRNVKILHLMPLKVADWRPFWIFDIKQLVLAVVVRYWGHSSFI